MHTGVHTQRVPVSESILDTNVQGRSRRAKESHAIEHHMLGSLGVGKRKLQGSSNDKYYGIFWILTRKLRSDSIKGIN